MPAHHADQFLGELALEVVGRGIGRLRVRIGRMNGESAARILLNVKGHLELPAFYRKLQAGKFGGHGGADVLLNFLLQLPTSGSLQRRQIWLASSRDESALGLGFNVISEVCD